MDSGRVRELAEDTLRRVPFARRAGREAIRTWERARLSALVGPDARAWRVTRRPQWLPETQFGEAATVIADHPATARLYALHAAQDMVLAAAAFEHRAGEGGSTVVRELVLCQDSSHPWDRLAHPLAHAAAIMLLERLHDIAHRFSGAGDLWVHLDCTCRPHDLRRVGFAEEVTALGEVAWHRADTADPVERLARAARTITHLRPRDP